MCTILDICDSTFLDYPMLHIEGLAPFIEDIPRQIITIGNTPDLLIV